MTRIPWWIARQECESAGVRAGLSRETFCPKSAVCRIHHPHIRGLNPAFGPAYIIHMRFKITLAALVLASLHATAAAAQTVDPPVHAASALVPLPASLVPDVDAGMAESTSRISARRVLVSTGVGALIGAGTGLVVGALASDGCGHDEDWCLFSPEEEIALTGVAGAIVGAGVGAVYGIVTGIRQPARNPAPVTLAPAANGGLTVGLTLRH